MPFHYVAPDLSVAPQLTPQDIGVAASQGFRSVILNRPDGEAGDQPARADLEAAAKRHGLAVAYVPVVSGQVTDENVGSFRQAMLDLPAPTLAFCRTGTRSITLWALSQAGHLSVDAILKTAAYAGFDLSGLATRLSAQNQASAPIDRPARSFDVVVVGGGAGGISTAASILHRRPSLNIAIIEPKRTHYYQPGWTLVGGGVFRRDQTKREMSSLIPKGVQWINTACAAFEPSRNEVTLEDGERVGYRVLIVSPGLKLNFNAVEGLKETLGKNGVTSNYLFDMAPYTWELVQSLKGGRALFTQPPMPIKCAGAPQKAMYMACDAWQRRGVLKDIDVSFHNAGGVLFGVQDYVPSLMQYIERYGIDLNFSRNLVAVDGARKVATFEILKDEVAHHRVEEAFDMLHVCPPQGPLDFIKASPLGNEAGWVEVDPETLQHTRYGNIFGLGDGCSAPNAKTAAAVRQQAPVVAENAVCVLDGDAPHAVYHGYGSCPLTVERGKIVLAEFSYGGKLDPTFPTWLVDGTKPTRAAWFLKEKMLPWLYFDWMLKGREFLAKPDTIHHRPTPREAQPACNDRAESKRAA